MRLELSPLKLLMMVWPVYALVAVSLVVYPDQWRHLTPSTLVLIASPVLILVVGFAVRGRWWLELTPQGLVHHTLLKSEFYAWERMGPVEIHAQHILHLPLIRTLWFRFPVDKAHGASEQITQRLGRRILLVFGDRSGAETMRLIESWRLGSRLG